MQAKNCENYYSIYKNAFQYTNKQYGNLVQNPSKCYGNKKIIMWNIFFFFSYGGKISCISRKNLQEKTSPHLLLNHIVFKRI
jgi:hypothetical protein